MFVQPTIAAHIINYHRLDLEAEARQRTLLRRHTQPEPELVKLKIPARVPRSWRRRYLWAK
jgi:hypothetical protein